MVNSATSHALPFGDKCGGSCFPNCTEEYCDPSKGCINIKKETKTTSSDMGNVYSPETRIYTDAVELKETYTSSGISEINTILIKEQPEQMSGMNVNYLTVGLGAIISMLLFVITMQLCKNSQSAKRKKSTEQKGYCSQVGYESSHQIQHAGDGEYNMISLSQQNGQFMQNMDHVYHQIDECMELVQTTVFSNIASDFKSEMSEVNEPTYPDKGMDNLGDRSSKWYSLPSIRDKRSDTDSYIQPVIVLENKPSNNKKENSMYIDVLE